MASTCVFNLNHSLGNKQRTVKDPRVLKTAVCSVGEGQRCGPPASVIKTAGPASAGRRASPLPALKVMLVWVFYFSLNFIVSRVKITGQLYFYMKSFFTKLCWWVVLDGWVLLMPQSRKLCCLSLCCTDMCFYVSAVFWCRFLLLQDPHRIWSK